MHRFWQWWAGTWFYPEQLEKSSIRRAVATAATGVHGTLLDVGCGAKPYRNLFSVNNYLGLEYLPSSPQYRLNTPPDIWADCQCLPIRSGSIDAILCTQVLEHLSNPIAFFLEAFRVLRPGGKLILTTNQEWGIHKAPYDYYRFTRFGLEHLAQEASFHIISLDARGGFWVMMGQRLAAYLFNRWVGRFRKDHKVIFILSFTFFSPIIAFVQLAAKVLDRIDRIEENTTGYALVARKPLESW
ncbi:MAG: class I SAM-dependent methyltransferase [Deltaproteobacteria bacterium]|nr:class I SAM-dependent methyltransferase [Desulfitobacteriaceae bacterium]MDI6855023.1 class I SAM-dependent methyltransferase [Deltaproteobacteria bacterium]